MDISLFDDGLVRKEIVSLSVAPLPVPWKIFCSLFESVLREDKLYNDVSALKDLIFSLTF